MAAGDSLLSGIIGDKREAAKTNKNNPKSQR
jgi:hypothetical protein